MARQSKTHDLFLILFQRTSLMAWVRREADEEAEGTGQTSLVVLEVFILGLTSGLVSTWSELSALPPPAVAAPPPVALAIALNEGLMSLALGLVGSRVLVPSSGIRSAYRLSYKNGNREQETANQTKSKTRLKTAHDHVGPHSSTNEVSGLVRRRIIGRK